MRDSLPDAKIKVGFCSVFICFSSLKILLRGFTDRQPNRCSSTRIQAQTTENREFVENVQLPSTRQWKDSWDDKMFLFADYIPTLTGNLIESKRHKESSLVAYHRRCRVTLIQKCPMISATAATIFESSISNNNLNILTPRVKPWVIQSFLTFDSMDRTLKCDHSLESC